MTIQFKIQIRGIKKPPVWRRIVMPDTCSFYDFHRIIQDAFGWCGYHLYQFQRYPYDRGWCIKETDDFDEFSWVEPEDPGSTNVAQFIQDMGLHKFVYVYDFGDDWIHDITVEEINEDDTREHPVCLAGKGACPPEDCGGIWGYEELKEEMSKEEMTAFDIDEVNAVLESFTPEDQEELSSSSDMELFGPTTLLDLLEEFDQEDLLSCADAFELKINRKSTVKTVRQKYAKYILDHPEDVLRMLPQEDLLLLEFMIENPNKGCKLGYVDDFREVTMIHYGFAEGLLDENDNYFIRIPQDFVQAVTPYVKKVMNDENSTVKYVFEAVIVGLTNLYGIVSFDFMVKEMMRLLLEKTYEEVAEILFAVQMCSLRVRDLLYHWEDLDIQSLPEQVVFLSSYGWETPEDLKKVIENNMLKPKQYKLFTAEEISSAASSPIPIIPNTKSKEFMDFLMDDLEYNEEEAQLVCHNLWYREMHRFDEEFYEGDPITYFQEEVLRDCDEDDEMYQRAMDLLDDYINAMPHWDLKGYSPDEIGQTDKGNERDTSGRQHFLRKEKTADPPAWYPGAGMLYNETGMPYVAEKRPRRNDPCPCGSGKKYKNCCGREN